MGGGHTGRSVLSYGAFSLRLKFDSFPVSFSVRHFSSLLIV